MKTIYEKRYITSKQAEAAATKAGFVEGSFFVEQDHMKIGGATWMVKGGHTAEDIAAQEQAHLAPQSARQETEDFIKRMQIAIEASLTDENLDACTKALNEREPKLEEAIFVALDEMIGKKREAIELVALEIEAEEQANRAQIEGVSETKGGKLWIKASSVEKPTKMVWIIADEMCALAEELGRARPSRKEVQDECVRRGIASGTARTQYQHWFKTNHEALVAPRATIGADGKIVPPTKG